ncbi:MAG TPA: DUF2059 domain-containing protein [Acidobacteriota bacterium]|mgnify:CR=1 FL=1|jgi:hypothetical protein|nr:DUF2059 domain-containing protein [Acidobacteriota bacterium]HNT18301.1 DUF2059 domain-containing protein [Acidobacteriota bacterium]HPA27595.1 DUF2059 domain-containing protein [Acidobacteriota bacterium]HQO20086.1 DUF2059 domain-containing protein [Acidobacteriota bacterium]HQQ47329.1 DUF2059 domain-containing protein [Acidobacteriota bacterium]
MKKMIMVALISAAAVFSARVAPSQEKKAEAPTPEAPKAGAVQAEPQISKEFRDEIVQLLKLIGAESLAAQYGDNFSRMIIGDLRSKDEKFSQKETNLVREETKKFMDEKFPELIERFVPVYAKHFTRDEVKGLIAFYSSPLGMKTIKELPLISRESMVIGNAWGKSVAGDVERRVMARLEKEGYKAPKPEDKAAPQESAPPPEKK